MKTIHEIKEEVAKEFHFINWTTLYGLDAVSNVIIDEIAKKYAQECIKDCEAVKVAYKNIQSDAYEIFKSINTVYDDI